MPDDVVELVDVGVVERRVYFIEDTEGRGLEKVHREQKRRGCQRLFTAAKLAYGQGSLSLGFCDDIDVGVERRIGINEPDITIVSAVEQGTENDLTTLPQR